MLISMTGSSQVTRRASTAAAWAVTLLLIASGSSAQSAGQESNFRHTTHREVECTECHVDGEQAVQSPGMTLADCRSCHHGAPAAANCLTCHASDDAHRINRPVTRTLRLEVASTRPPERVLPFSHITHEGIRCQTCHTGGAALSAADVECTGCHQDHHRPTATCLRCHEPPAAGAHDREVHLGCGGSACHEGAPASIQTVPRTRAFCLACHADMTYHKPEQACASCHALPPPRAGVG